MNSTNCIEYGQDRTMKRSAGAAAPGAKGTSSLQPISADQFPHRRRHNSVERNGRVVREFLGTFFSFYCYG